MKTKKNEMMSYPPGIHVYIDKFIYVNIHWYLFCSDVLDFLIVGISVLSAGRHGTMALCSVRFQLGAGKAYLVNHIYSYVEVDAFSVAVGF